MTSQDYFDLTSAGTAGDTDEETLSAVDELVQSALAYNTPERLRDLMEFASRLPRVAPFNAMLLHIQNPQVRFVATAREWRLRGRSVKAGTRPMVIMKLMGPVSFVFDVADTKGAPLPYAVEQEIKDPFAVEGTVTTEEWEKLCAACLPLRIKVVEELLGPDAAGSMARLSVAAPDVRYVATVNANHSLAARFVTLAHELGHLFCGHLGASEDEFWESRPNLDHAARELEAEAVAYQVGLRRRLTSASSKYLSSFLRPGVVLPTYSLELVLTVVHVVEELAKGKLPSRERTRRRKAVAATTKKPRKSSPPKESKPPPISPVIVQQPKRDPIQEALAEAFEGLF